MAVPKASGAPPHPVGDDFSAQVAKEIAPDFLRTDPAELAEYGKDWTKVYAPAAGAVAFPRSTDEVSRVMRIASAHQIGVVPSGGRTGLAGGAVAMNGELVLSLSRMRRLDPV